jgi:LPS sulfotransferase NodH
LVDNIHDHNAAWYSWFTAQDADRSCGDVENLVADPGHALHRILHSVGVAPPASCHIGVGWLDMKAAAAVRCQEMSKMAAAIRTADLAPSE